MSESNFTGIVEKVHKNDAGYWSILMADGQWFGHGKMKPTCDAGDEVAFDYSKNGKYNNADPDTMEVISSDNAVETKKAKPAWGGKKRAASEGGSKEGYWEKKEERDVLTQKEIRFQAARNAAIEVLTAAVENKLIVIPEGKKAGSQFEVFLTYIDKVTDRYVRAVEAVNTPVAAPVAASKSAVVKKTVVVEQEPSDDDNQEPEFG